MFTNYNGVSFPITNLTDEFYDPKNDPKKQTAGDTVQEKISKDTQYFPDSVYYSKDNGYVTIKEVLEND
jgi:hypothetical protein